MAPTGDDPSGVGVRMLLAGGFDFNFYYCQGALAAEMADVSLTVIFKRSVLTKLSAVMGVSGAVNKSRAVPQMKS